MRATASQYHILIVLIENDHASSLLMPLVMPFNMLSGGNTDQIYLTESYGALIPRSTGARSGSPTGYGFRPSDFWKDFDVQVFNEDKELISVTTSGEPTFLCSYDGGCTLTGATIHLEFLAKSFSSDSATIQVTPLEGEPVSVDFDLTQLR
ncbi:MAG TPA: hypothetical protein VIW93_00365 [Candidatus Acidoferrum sp.]